MDAESEDERGLLRWMYQAEPYFYLTSLVGQACSIEQDTCEILCSISPLILGVYAICLNLDDQLT